MIEVKDYGFNYHLIYHGNKEDYIPFYLAMNKIPDCTKLKGAIGYKMPKCYLPELEKQFVLFS